MSKVLVKRAKGQSHIDSMTDCIDSRLTTLKWQTNLKLVG